MAKKTFKNEFAFTNDGQPETASSNATITYGKALEKHDPTNPTDPTNPDGGNVNPGGNDRDPNGTIRPGGNDRNPTGNGKPSTGSTKPGADDRNPGGKVDANGANQLPKTGEEQYVLYLALGVLLVAMGSTLVWRKRKNA